MLKVYTEGCHTLNWNGTESNSYHRNVLERKRTLSAHCVGTNRNSASQGNINFSHFALVACVGRIPNAFVNIDHEPCTL
jgi:hypothetical protein